MKLKALWAAGVAVSMLAGAVYAEDITIHGSTTVEANLFAPYEAELEKMTGDNYTVVGNGSSRGITGIDTGAAQIGMISSDINSVLGKLDMTARAGEFVHDKVGEAVATYAVHASNPVKSLTKEQVVGILQGTITNWSEVGGNDMPIVVFTEFSGGGFRTTIEKKVLGKKPITGPNLREMTNGSQVVQVAAQLPNAFATTPLAMLKGSTMTRVTTDADVIQPLVLLVKGERTGAYNRLVEASKKMLQ